MGWVSLVLGIAQEALSWMVIVAKARLEQNEALAKTKGDMLDAARKSIASGDTSHIIALADNLRQSS